VKRLSYCGAAFFLLLLTLALPVPCSAQSSGVPTLTVDAYEERYNFTLTELIDTLPIEFDLLTRLRPGVAAAEAILEGCANFSLLSHTFTADDGSINVKADIFSVVGSIVNPIINGKGFNPKPEFGPCPSPVIERLTHVSGGISLYDFHVGTGLVRKKVRKATFTLSNRLVIEADSNVDLEVPVAVSGSVFAAESFGDFFKQYGKAKLEMSGSIGGESFSPEPAEVESITTLPEQATISFSKRFLVPRGTGRRTIQISATGKAEVEIRAKSGGQFGQLAGAVTAGADFPGSFLIGAVTGPGGTPLPANVRIYDADTGAVYADTRVFLGNPNVQTTATLTRDTATNEVVAKVTFTNSGPGEARNMQITSATLNSKAASAAMPFLVGRLIPLGQLLPIAPGPAPVVTLRFPASVGPPGTRTTLRINGTRAGGSFGGTFRVILP